MFPKFGRECRYSIGNLVLQYIICLWSVVFYGEWRVWRVKFDICEHLPLLYFNYILLNLKIQMSVYIKKI